METANIKVYTEEQVIDSLFVSGGTLALEGIEVLKHRKNAKDIYFTYKGKNFCLNKHNCILKYGDIHGKRWFQHGVMEFENYREYMDVLDALKEYLGR